MSDALREQLDHVGRRYHVVRTNTLAMAGNVAVLLIAVPALLIAWQRGVDVPWWVWSALFAVPMAVHLLAKWLTRHARHPLWVARRLEARYPELDRRLLTSLEQRPDPATGRLGYLQRQLIAETLRHAEQADWTGGVPTRRMNAFSWANAALIFALCGVMLLTLLRPPARQVSPNGQTATAGDVTVEPGDTSVERGSAVLVLARFAGPLPGDVTLLTKTADGTIGTAAMSKSLDDPVFAARVPRVDAAMEYAVRHGDTQTRWFTAGVFELPELKQADAELAFPAYTKLPARKEQDVRSVTAVEGTTATFTLQLNKPVTVAELRPANGEPIKLLIDPATPDRAEVTLNLKQSQKLTLNLTDADGRHNKSPAVEFALNVNPNRPPELKPVTPGRDVDVSPIQELSTGVRVIDDFGVRRVGVSYGLAGRPTQEVTLAENVPGGQKRDVSRLVPMEQIGAKTDELLSYYFWAEDTAADGSTRRTSGDLYFAEVRPFEEIFRQGEQPSAQEQQQQQQQGQQGGNGQQAEQLAELQKQVIAATWKIIRHETNATPTEQFAPDGTLVRDAQTSAREQAAALGERLTDAKSAGYLKSVLEHMDRAVGELDATVKAGTPVSLTTALASEQAAYQALLRLRAREFEVTRGSRQQQQSGQSASSSSSRRQQQLEQLQLEQEQNRYETQRTATPANENPQQRESRQVLNRLKELARRQEDLNRQMQEAKSALDQAKDVPQREEVQRQLSRLRDQQAEQLRDTDELRDRMNRPENQESLADARQQMEQTRENVRRASEALQQNRVPEAAASGARASEQLNNLRDQVRRGAAGELAESMTELRQNARGLDENQKRLSEQLKNLDAEARPALRDGDDRKQLAEQLGQQKQDLEKLTDAMRKAVESSESTEPLVSKQLYDTLRQSGQQQTDKALDVSRQLLDRGFTNEARQAEAEAAKGVSQLRQGVEQAATGVLGDEAEALRRAKAELDRLADQLQREVDRARPRETAADAPPTQRRPDRLASNFPATRPDGAGNDASPSTRPAGRFATNDPATRPGDAAGPPSSDTPATLPTRLALGGERPADAADAAAPRPGDSPGRPDADVPSDRPGQDGLRGNAADPRNGENGSASRPTESNDRPGDGERPSGDQRPGGERPDATRPDTAGPQQGQPNASANPPRPGGRPGLRGPPAQGTAGGNPPGERPGESSADDTQRPDGSRPPGDATPPGDGRRPGEAARPGGRENARDNNRVANAGDPNGPGRGDPAADADAANAPLTGGGFRDWSDRLRDVEEMITDPALRDRVARVRERATGVRADVKRHSKPPNWDVVQQTVVSPLDELRGRVAEELLRRTSPDAVVPLDRENVPPQYAEQVRQYYERLGAGR